MSTVPVVSVRGECTFEVDPELAVLHVAVKARGKDRAQTMAALSERSRVVAAEIAGFSAGIEKSETSRLHVYPELKRHGADKVSAYVGESTTQVTVSDFAVLADLVAALAALDLVELDGPWWTLRPDSPEYRRARLAAVADAVTRAREYAEAIGGRITGLLELADNGMDRPMALSAPTHRMRAASAALPAERPTFDLEPARQQVTGRVEARFTMTEPDLSAIS
jgi:uncharacterized protein YggE